MKNQIKNFLETKGWFVRKLKGLNVGTNIYYDIDERLKINLKTIIDVGAHKGETIDGFKNKLNSLVVFAFEPISKNYKILNEKYGNFKNIHLFNCALSNFKGEMIIKLEQDSQTNSLRNSVSGNKENTETISVEMLDNIFTKTSIDKIDLLKIDVEGFEKTVLEGGINLLKNKKIKAILLECTLDETDIIHSNLIELKSFLEPLEYNLTAIYDQVVWHNPTRLSYFNALFILNES
ncbi:MAG: FkbM family methyltransferase [Cytophagales bacterium]|nr:MAG: FkbM family methyltransferase [Cytophagales bacterium]